MPSRLPIAILVLAAAAGAGTYFYLRSKDHPVDEAAALPPAPGTPPASPPPLLAAPAPTREPEHPQEMIRYPDGTYMPALNGVKIPPVLSWPADHPFSPIIGKRMSAGTEWYVHADGTQTTTVMTWRSDLNREVALCHVAVPKPALPIDPNEGKQ